MIMEYLAALVAVLTPIGGLLLWLWRKRAQRLSPEEKEILAACAQRGEIRIMQADLYGEWVRADSKDFLDPTDPAYAARFREAFHLLSGRGLVLHEDGMLHRLTGSGFKAARSLKKPEPNQSLQPTAPSRRG
jgi:hypothetical protein